VKMLRVSGAGSAVAAAMKPESRTIFSEECMLMATC